jgi:hypothetical protein
MGQATKEAYIQIVESIFFLYAGILIKIASIGRLKLNRCVIPGDSTILLAIRYL